MKRCPITYEIINDNEYYSQHGLKKLSPKLKTLQPLAYTAKEQREEAVARAIKMSVQGVQPKVSAKLNIKESKFELAERHGQYILKPQSELYRELPENEAITMTMAETVGIRVPLHGLIYAKDGSRAYFIKRFDRYGKNKKYSVEDFAQLSEKSRDTKYNSSMERVADIIKKYCNVPDVEFKKLFRLTVFNFLIGNEDMHLKNFSLISQDDMTVLSPAYDLLNTTIAQPRTQAELALPLKDKKTNLQRKDIVEYFGAERLELNSTVINKTLNQFKNAMPKWQHLLKISFLSIDMQNKYLALLANRSEQLEL
jgi:serine/threonine-protein kinase HipA